jgi:hypothetical protein
MKTLLDIQMFLKSRLRDNFKIPLEVTIEDKGDAYEEELLK